MEPATVSLPTICCDAMDAWKAEQARLILATPSYEDEGYIFVRQHPFDDQPLASTPLQNMFYRLAKAAGLPRIRFHDLRHTCASLMIMEEEHPRVIQGQMRHSQMATTMNIYSHLMPGATERAVEKVGQRLDLRNNAE